ncbi:MAG: glutamate synthase central domain-containing protein, partial [Candidatus Omnitrophica bacterium]|nr:glutamate synthase central domain-containing protein [Candidatus Omnitrophota bacterium]
MKNNYIPAKQGLYDPEFEHDSCGVGFVCDIKGHKSNEIVKQGLDVLRRLAHRGATGADPKTGDGAGLLIQIPHEFFKKVCLGNKINLPARGEYGTGIVFLPQEKKEREFCKDTFAKIIKEEGQVLLGWRRVPVDNSDIGKAAKGTQPEIEQVFIGKNRAIKDQLAFERKLYVVRKRIENDILGLTLKQKSFFYITNLSSRTISYKGLLTPGQLEGFFVDLKDKNIKSALALVHSRYSTNTFPTWSLSQPFRYLAHNGEINTLRGNINWMKARQSLLRSKLFGSDIKKIMPVILPGGSDSAAIDNVFELLTLSGRSLSHAMMMLIPAAWEENHSLSEELRGFYKYHTCLTEPWDGPAAIAFTDGERIGAVLDRNGLRPARYIITKNGLAVMASEVGVLDIEPSAICKSGRLEPGKILFIDTQLGRIIEDDELKRNMSERQPYSLWVKENNLELDSLSAARQTHQAARKNSGVDTLVLLKAFGYTREDLKVILKPMAETAQEPTGSMGNDTPWAVLSNRPQLLYNYFKQLFAQVTNPAIDPIREELVMSLETYIGPEKNLLDETPRHCYRLKIKQPILSNDELEKIRHIDKNGFKTKTISLLFKASQKQGFRKSLERVCRQASLAIKDGFTFIVLSDRGVNSEYAALPGLLAVASVHHHLVRESLRTQIGIILESGEPREVHHLALLFGYGVDCVNPYLAYEAIGSLVKDKELDIDLDSALHNYVKALDKGILKILSKMGISTLQSYRGAQIFEALGLGEEVIEKYFTGTASRIGGAGLDIIAQETLLRHKEAYPDRKLDAPYLSTGGIYQWKQDGEFHLWNPDSIAALQDAV